MHTYDKTDRRECERKIAAPTAIIADNRVEQSLRPVCQHREQHADQANGYCTGPEHQARLIPTSRATVAAWDVFAMYQPCFIPKPGIASIVKRFS